MGFRPLIVIGTMIGSFILMIWEMGLLRVIRFIIAFRSKGSFAIASN
jgi:hypothetical protein